MTVLDDIAASLVAANLGQQESEIADWFIRVGYIQDKPDRSICLYFAGGAPPETALKVGYPNIQVRVRGNSNDFNAVQQKEDAIFCFLHANDAPVRIGEDYVFCYAQQSAPISMGQDENRRPALVRNYRIMKGRSERDTAAV